MPSSPVLERLELPNNRVHLSFPKTLSQLSIPTCFKLVILRIHCPTASVVTVASASETDVEKRRDHYSPTYSLSSMELLRINEAAIVCSSPTAQYWWTGLEQARCPRHPSHS
ncbi:hypothetical protein PCANC_07715 [Puccinia coronata f. sp. avenae]|uniref:Uncharacterized protein n=1 Tax=Puccinia coronata f. sp. avenae TaxID=200324 RepID=A0A2N5SMG8_9BASI|nr:hypothetical protein PCASD_21862 [Puccinia coronata f. sp. avenae]PLW14429.1 hypothetical protein PCANC_15971 [Puccinia coronata f. sp. avenae]PLW44088.1 hypothetical protein PCASD_04879 [Puccinia coronata f. sp. avenae]PLW52531.1 hypothetical protein PCANC_07715 [Puccinia coronata f. sp. avenae]